MEFVFEFILELIFEGTLEASKSKKVPKYIRYPLIFLIILFFLAVIGLVFLCGILFLKESILGGIFFVTIGGFMLIMSVIKFRETYLLKKR